MLSKFSTRENEQTQEKVWVGKFKNICNIPHWHNECEIIYVNSGKLTVLYNGKHYIVNTGNAVYFESGKTHSIQSDENTIISAIQFDSILAKPLMEKQLASFIINKDYGFEEYYNTLKRELKEKKQHYTLRLEAYITLLITEIFRQEKTQKADEDTTSAVRFSKLLDLIDKQYNYITFKEAARFMFLSEAYFSKLFTKLAGMTFSQYLNNVKIEKAIIMLQDENLSVTDIAMNCGFNTIRNFNRTFKNITGHSPKRLPQDFNLNTVPRKIYSSSFNPTQSGYNEIK